MDNDVWRYVRRSLIKSRRLGTRTPRMRVVVVAGLCFSIVAVALLTPGSGGPRFDSGYYVNQRTNEEVAGLKRSTGRLYVAVMTTGKFLNTRAKAVFNTWGSNPFVSKIDFFARKLPYDTNKYNYSIVTLRDVDDMAYPPQKKSFRMLQYICETQLDKFDWFLRADDDVYVKVQEFIGYVVLPSNSKIGYLGHPGHGRDWDSDAHRLLGTDTYCMGGPGVLFSNWALRKLCPHLESCRTSVLIKNEDIELGRCVKKHVGPGCKTPKEMMYRFFHVANDKLPPLLTGNYSNFKPFKRALTLHPLKNPDDMYRLHRYYMSFRKELRTDLIKKNGVKKPPPQKKTLPKNRNIKKVNVRPKAIKHTTLKPKAKIKAKLQAVKQKTKAAGKGVAGNKLLKKKKISLTTKKNTSVMKRTMTPVK